MTAKVVLAITIVFFILAENARGAVRSVDPDLMVMGRIVGLRSLGTLWKVVLPSAVPALFAGLRLTFTYSLLGVVASEMIAATNGVGQDIVLFSSSYQVNTVFAILIALVIFAVIVNTIFTVVERWLLRWQET
jgi:NitT/TauT family transport system permease protein